MLEIIIKISSSFFFFFFFGQSAFIESLDSQICAEKTHLKKISGKITNDFFFVFFLGGGGGWFNMRGGLGFLEKMAYFRERKKDSLLDTRFDTIASWVMVLMLQQVPRHVILHLSHRV